MQKHELILNRRFVGSNGSQSQLQLQNNYFVYTQSLGNGLTNEFNIRAYLNNPNNQVIIDQFIQYIESNTTQEQFLEIYYDDTKLKNVFNQFFSTTVQGGQITGSAVIESNLQNTITITIYDNLWNWNGESVSTSLDGIPESISNSTRQNQGRLDIVSFTSEDSYYIPVNINHNTGQIPRNKFKICDEQIDTRINPLQVLATIQGVNLIQPSDFVQGLNNAQNISRNNTE